MRDYNILQNYFFNKLIKNDRVFISLPTGIGSMNFIIRRMFDYATNNPNSHVKFHCKFPKTSIIEMFYEKAELFGYLNLINKDHKTKVINLTNGSKIKLKNYNFDDSFNYDFYVFDGFEMKSIEKMHNILINKKSKIIINNSYGYNALYMAEYYGFEIINYDLDDLIRLHEQLERKEKLKMLLDE